MEEEKNQQPEVIDPSEQIQSDVLPVIRIGVETVLSRMPIHNLAKKGKVDIQITRRGPDGDVDVKWEVSYNERYGQPRQLAYKLDTIIVNRRIDEEGRPIPRFIRLGSLNELCEQLRSQKNELKRAIRQNATTSINAKLKYRGNDGSERELEALFTRYSVYFTGEKLPDGRVADAVYIELNGPYREVLNNAPIRPLNYEYLKALAPAPQRFYEIISSRIYAAQKNKNPYARILYSEFCTYSALTRHLDYENFRVQMAKIHKPHLKSGYIVKAHYEETTDAAGNLDWMMCYQPGGRARAEYMTFARKSKQLDAKFEAVEESDNDFSSEPEQGGLSYSTAPAKPRKAAPKDPLLLELTSRGITENKGKKILASLQAGQQVLDQLEWGDYLIQSDPAKFRSPAGFYVYLLTENVIPSAAFETNRQRKAREEAQDRAESERLRQMRLQDEYDDYRSQQVEDYIHSQVLESELTEITARKRQHLAQSYRNFRLMPQETIKSMVWGAVKAEIRPRVKFLSLEEFAAQRESQPNLFTAPEAIEQGREASPALEAKTKEAPEAKKLAASATETPKDVATPPPAEKTPYRSNLSVTADAAQKEPASEREPNESDGLGANEVTLLERYEEFQRKEARRALDRLEILERGRRMKAARTYLLNEHPEKDHYQQLIAEERYEEFHKFSEEHLFKVTLEDLRLPNYEDWKRYALSALSAK